MSRQNSGASLGSLLMQCCDNVIKCRDNISAFRIPLCCNIFLVLILILYRNIVMKYHDNLSTFILHSSLSLLQHSFACCDKLLQVALGFCRDNAVIML